MNIKTYSAQANKIMRTILNIENEASTMSLEQLEAALNTQLDLAAALNKHKPTDTFLYECEKAAARIHTNRKNNTIWNA